MIEGYRDIAELIEVHTGLKLGVSEGDENYKTRREINLHDFGVDNPREKINIGFPAAVSLDPRGYDHKATFNAGSCYVIALILKDSRVKIAHVLRQKHLNYENYDAEVIFDELITNDLAPDDIVSGLFTSGNAIDPEDPIFQRISSMGLHYLPNPRPDHYLASLEVCTYERLLRFGFY